MGNIFSEDKKSPYAKAYYKFIGLSNSLEIRIKQALKAYGITHAQLNVLYHLAKISPASINPGELKNKLIVSNPDLTRLVDRMVEKELVHRQTCPDNRRKVDLQITEKGLAVFQSAHAVAKKSVNNFFEDDISLEEARQFSSLLNKIDI